MIGMLYALIIYQDDIMMTKGFTLIELMIGLAIIAILASIAIPAYQDYLTRARILEGFNLAATAKIAVVDTSETNGGLAQVTTGNSAYTSPSTLIVTSITIQDGGDIQILYNDPPIFGGGMVVLHPNQTSPGTPIDWSCNAAAGTTVAAKYLPANCR